MCLGIPEGMAPLRAVFSSLLRSSFLSELAPPSPLLPSPAQSSSGYLCRSPQSGPPPRGQPLHPLMRLEPLGWAGRAGAWLV